MLGDDKAPDGASDASRIAQRARHAALGATGAAGWGRWSDPTPDRTGEHVKADLRTKVLLAVLLLGVVAALILAVVLLVPPTHAAPRAEARLLVSSREGRIVDWTVRSASVPGEQPVRILLPRTYDAQPRRSWPVLYLLHGCCDTFASWTRSSDVVQFTEDEGVIIVMPDDGQAGFYSDWRHGPKWERYHTVELPRLLASRFA